MILSSMLSYPIGIIHDFVLYILWYIVWNLICNVGKNVKPFLWSIQMFL